MSSGKEINLQRSGDSFFFSRYFPVPVKPKGRNVGQPAFVGVQSTRTHLPQTPRAFRRAVLQVAMPPVSMLRHGFLRSSSSSHQATTPWLARSAIPVGP